MTGSSDAQAEKFEKELFACIITLEELRKSYARNFLMNQVFFVELV